MKDNATGSLDRRDFVIASLATFGASAALVAAAARRRQSSFAAPDGNDLRRTSVVVPGLKDVVQGSTCAMGMGR